MLAARVDHHIVVVVRDPIELRFLGKLLDRNDRLQVTSLPLCLPAQARRLVDIEIGEQDFAAGTRQRDRGRACECRLSDAALL